MSDTPIPLKEPGTRSDISDEKNIPDRMAWLLDPSSYEKKLDEMDHAEYKVAWLLNRFKELRDSDKLLIFYFWHHVDGYRGSLEHEVVLKLTPAETVTRARRRIQNTYGLFLPLDPETMEKRQICEDAVRTWARARQQIRVDK